MRLAGLVPRWSDRLNPMLVKEVRQGLRTRTFVASFSTLLGASVLISLVASAARSGSTSGDVGAGAFLAYLGAFALVGFFVLPITAHRSFVREREADTWPILQMTGLRPRGILRGKIASTLVQGALYASAIAPFLFFSYFLQGISLLAIVGAMAGAVVWQAFLTTVAVSSAAFADTRAGRAITSALLGLFLPLATLSVVSSFGSVLAASRFGGVGRLPEPMLLLIPLWLAASLSVLLFEAAAARLSSGSAQHAVGPRLAALGHLAGSGLAVAVLSGNRGEEAGVVWAVYGSVFTWAFGLFAASTPDGLERAHRQGRTRRHLLLPGALRGWRFTLLLQGVVFVTAVATVALAGGEERDFEHVVSACAVPPVLLGVPIALTRGLSPESLGSPLAVRLLTAGLALGLLVTMPFTELYELLRAPVVMASLAIVSALLADRVLAWREVEAERAVDLARGGTT